MGGAGSSAWASAPRCEQSGPSCPTVQCNCFSIQLGASVPLDNVLREMLTVIGNVLLKVNVPKAPAPDQDSGLRVRRLRCVCECRLGKSGFLAPRGSEVEPPKTEGWVKGLN